MNRENATKIARRILDRVEADNNSIGSQIEKERIAIVIRLDSLVDEIMAGFALVEPMGTKRDFEREHKAYLRGMERGREKRAGERLEDHQKQLVDCYGKQTSRIADDSIGLGSNPIMQGKVQSLAGVKVTHHESDPISGYRALKVGDTLALNMQFYSVEDTIAALASAPICEEPIGDDD